jgi:hypothetical protein
MQNNLQGLFYMAMNVTDNFFIKAKPVWAKGLETEKI